MRSVSERTVSGELAGIFLDVAERRGVDRRAFALAPDLLRACQGPPYGMVNGVQLGMLFDTISHALDDAYLGFLAEGMTARVNMAIKRVASESLTFRQSIISYTSFRNSIRQDISFELHEDRAKGIFEFRRLDRGLLDPGLEYAFYWFVLAVTYRFMCWHIGKRIKLRYVKFRASEPLYASPYPFNCPVLYGADTNGLAFSTSYLRSPIVRTRDQMVSRRLLLRESDDWLTAPQAGETLGEAVEFAIDSMATGGELNPSLELVASHLRLSSRSLRRKLWLEGLSFSAVKDRLRARRASDTLLQSPHSISEVARTLGFVEPGDFTRTFKRWTGLTPSEFRIRRARDA